jgi:hypothetical protein
MAYSHKPMHWRADVTVLDDYLIKDSLMRLLTSSFSSKGLAYAFDLLSKISPNLVFEFPEIFEF